MRVTARLARQRAPRTNDEWPWESPCSMLLRICASPHGDRSHRHRGARDEHRRAMILRRLIERGYVGAKQLVEPVEVMDIVLSGVTLHVGVVQAVLELLELSAEVAPLA